MSRTVGLPSAVAVRLVLEGKFHKPGVVVPVIAELYEPVLDELARLGISVTESVEFCPPETAAAIRALTQRRKGAKAQRRYLAGGGVFLRLRASVHNRGSSAKG